MFLVYFSNDFFGTQYFNSDYWSPNTLSVNSIQLLVGLNINVQLSETIIRSTPSQPVQASVNVFLNDSTGKITSTLVHIHENTFLSTSVIIGGAIIPIEQFDFTLQVVNQANFTITTNIEMDFTL